MKERILTQIEILDLSNRDGSHFYDNKAFEIKGDKIQKIAVAFANADGGEFIIGIKDKKEESNPFKRWQGIDDMEAFNFVFQNLTQLSLTIPHSFEFLDDYSPQSDPIDFTVNQNLVDRKTYDPRTAGILLFSDNPIPLLPKRCGIKITRYETSEEVPEREHLKNQYSVEGCLNEQIKQASKIITDIMESVQIMGAKGLEKVKYPPETIWEILVNVVIMHSYA